MDLLANKIGDEGAKSISSSLIELKKLRHLNLCFYENLIGNQGAESLFSALNNLTNLSFLQLNLGYNKINKKKSEFPALSKLINLNLGENDISI